MTVKVRTTHLDWRGSPDDPIVSPIIDEHPAGADWHIYQEATDGGHTGEALDVLTADGDPLAHYRPGTWHNVWAIQGEPAFSIPTDPQYQVRVDVSAKTSNFENIQDPYEEALRRQAENAETSKAHRIECKVDDGEWRDWIWEGNKTVADFERMLLAGGPGSLIRYGRPGGLTTTLWRVKLAPR